MVVSSNLQWTMRSIADQTCHNLVISAASPLAPGMNMPSGHESVGQEFAAPNLGVDVLQCLSEGPLMPDLEPLHDTERGAQPGDSLAHVRIDKHGDDRCVRNGAI